MATYHLSQQIISRKEGRTSVACASYRCGYMLRDERLGENFNFSRSDRVGYTAIMLPKCAPAAFSDRSTLWNEVEAIEKRKDAQVAKEADIALPSELTEEQNIELAREFCQTLVDQGMIADLCLHNLDGDNPHFHVMTTTRSVDSDGFGKKNRDWNDKQILEDMRLNWQNICNKHLEKYGHDARIDHRSNIEREIDREPEIHHGNVPVRIERNDEIKKRNSIKEMAESAIKMAATGVKDLFDYLTPSKQKEVDQEAARAAYDIEYDSSDLCLKCSKDPCTCTDGSLVSGRRNKLKL